MKMTKKKAALAGLLAAAAAGGTFAYFNQTLSVTNIFDTGTYDTELVEEFKPSDGENWEPGTSVNKDVTVRNTGSLPVVVRVKFQEKWVSKVTGNTLYEMDTTVNKDMLGAENPQGARNKFENVYQGDSQDGLTGIDVDDSVVYKTMIPDGGWVYNPADGYYYYEEVLPGASEDAGGNQTIAETTKLLDGVTLEENIDMGAYREIRYYATTDSRPEDGSEDWVEFATDSNANYISTAEMNDRLTENGGQGITYMKSVANLINPELGGYSNAEYTLVVTAQTVQATNQAVNTVFGDGKTFDYAALGLDWTLPREEETQK